MTLSIITVNYNNAVGLRNTIQSVANQSCQSTEFIIIDGGSTDGSALIIEENSEIITYWVSERDKGIYDAMNKGIKRATGQYLMFLNSGDLLADDTILALCVKTLTSKKEIDIFYGNIIVANHVNPIYDRHIYPNKIDIKFLKNDTLNHQASLINRRLFEEFGRYPTNYKLASDYWLFLRSCLQQKKFHHINHCLVVYDFSGASSQDNYANYRHEKKLIWDSLVPSIINDLVNENESLASELQKLRQVLSHRIIIVANKINYLYQKLKYKISR